MSNVKDEEKDKVINPFTFDKTVKDYETESTKSAYDKVYNSETGLNKQLADYGTKYTYANQQALDDARNNYSAWSKKDFNYDFNADALYQQYKDKYIQQGKMAMADTIGQASAMTGGYGNSYAATVGNQAYQSYLQQLNDVVPELYQMAYDRHLQEGQNYLNEYSLLSSDRSADYGLWSDERNRLLAERDYYTGRYDSGRAWDYGLYSDDKAYAYQNHRDAITDKQWQDQFDFAREQYNDSKFLAGGGGYKVSTDSNGKPVVEAVAGESGGGDISTVPSYIIEKVKTFTNNEQLIDYIDTQEASEAISALQATQLLAEYIDQNEGYLETTETTHNYKAKTYEEMASTTKGWTVVNNGGMNLLGIDANAVVIAPNGEQMTLAQLRTKLKSEGKTQKEANKLIKNLQQNLTDKNGKQVSSNWLFRW